MKRETTAEGSTRVTLHWNELFVPGVTAKAVLRHDHPLHGEFITWWRDRHGYGPGVLREPTKRQAAKFLRNTGRR